MRGLIEKLDETEAALWLAAWQGDRVAWTLLHAPVDDEPETADEQAGVREAKAAYARGDVVSHDELMRQLES